VHANLYKFTYSIKMCASIKIKRSWIVLDPHMLLSVSAVLTKYFCGRSLYSYIIGYIIYLFTIFQQIVNKTVTYDMNVMCELFYKCAIIKSVTAL